MIPTDRSTSRQVDRQTGRPVDRSTDRPVDLSNPVVARHGLRPAGSAIDPSGRARSCERAVAGRHSPHWRAACDAPGPRGTHPSRASAGVHGQPQRLGCPRAPCSALMTPIEAFLQHLVVKSVAEHPRDGLHGVPVAREPSSRREHEVARPRSKYARSDVPGRPRRRLPPTGQVPFASSCMKSRAAWARFRREQGRDHRAGCVRVSGGPAGVVMRLRVACEVVGLGESWASSSPGMPGHHCVLVLQAPCATSRAGQTLASSCRLFSPKGHLTCGYLVPPAGFEPAPRPPEGSALSPELRGPGVRVKR